MGKELYESKVQLIPYETRHLSIKANLIKRGLNLVSSLHARPLRVLFSGDKYIGEVIIDDLKRIYQGRYNITGFLAAEQASEILDFAETQMIDVFILILNNIIFSSGNRPFENRIEKALEFLTFIRKNYAKPIIGLFGLPDDPSFEQRVKDAGADFVFRMPFEWEPFNKAFESCLFPPNGIGRSKSGQTESTQ